MNIRKLTLLFVLGMLCMGSIGIVSAGSVTVDTTVSEAKINEKVTVPVIMHDADRIQSFTMTIPTSDTIVLNTTTPLDSFGTWSKSEIYTDTGKFIWVTNDPAYGISGKAVTLFYIDVTPASNAKSPIAVTVNVDDIYDLDDTEITANYPVTPGLLEIPNVLTVNTPPAPSITPTSAEVTLTTPTRTGTSPASTTVPRTDVPTEPQTPAATQGPVSVFGILAGLGFAGILGRKFT